LSTCWRKLLVNWLWAWAWRRRATVAVALHGDLAVLTCDIRSEFDILPEVADVASNLLPWLQREGDYGNEAEGKPFPSLEDVCADVSTVLALHCDILISF